MYDSRSGIWSGTFFLLVSLNSLRPGATQACLHDGGFGMEGVIAELLARGAALESPLPIAYPRVLHQAKQTVLHSAALLSNKTVVQMLLASGADRDLQTSTGDNAIQWALITDNVEVFEALLEDRDGGAVKKMLNHRGLIGTTTTLGACVFGAQECLRICLSKGADISARNDLDQGALQVR